ncbi:transmembrane protein 272-like isoform X1 [Pristis pectinata]|uniref:transmembrane protein 272-like isoform X1 n=1 Tax=Pristis pectinata TaxID=685728 RepID=UPI00223D71D5|nr:transmembrane protein 272-like isoform X1 [Pristis pectinata]
MDGESSFYTPLLQTIEEPPVSPAASVCMKVLTSILAIASITIGTIYLDSCTKQYLIPIYLIVSGSFTLFFMILSLVPCGSSGESSTGAAHKSGSVWKSLASVFSFIWFICGNVWIYSIYKPNYIDKSSSDYCDKTLYLFAFWLTTAIYILLGITLLLGCCALLCAFILSGSFLLRQRT